jgi:hypothetical protein
MGQVKFCAILIGLGYRVPHHPKKQNQYSVGQLKLQVVLISLGHGVSHYPKKQE